MKRCVSVLWAVGVLIGLGPSATAREPSLASLVPANAIAYVATPDLTELNLQWLATGAARLWQSDEFASFREAFHTATRLDAGGAVSLLGISWQQLLAVASGEACCALVPVGDDVGYILLVEVSRKTDLAQKAIDGLRPQAASRTYFVTDGVLGITNRDELAKAPAENLASVESFAAIMKRTRAKSTQLTWYVDPWALRPIAFDSKTWKQLADNGFKVIQAAGGTMTLSSDSYDLQHHWSVYAPGKREKASRLLDFAPLNDWQLPEWIPADVDSVTSIQWNLVGALLGCGSLFDAAYAEGEEGTFEAVLEDIKVEPTGPQVDLAELLRLQAGPVLSLSKTLEDGTTAVIYAVKVNNEAQVADALQRMFKPDKDVEPKQVGKHTIWVFKDAKAGANARPGLGPDLSGYALAAAHSYLFVATTAQVLEKVLAVAPLPKLIEDDVFRRLEGQAKERRPQDAVGWRVSLSAAGLRPVYEGLRAGGAIDLGQILGDPRAQTPELDMSKLPSGEILAKFIAAGFGFINQTEEGWDLQGYIEKSPQ